MDREEISARFHDQAFESPFRSFMQAGFECSTHVLPAGRRLDVVAATDHDRLVEADFDRAVDCGFLTVREGLRWHLIEKSAATFDFSSALPIIEAAQRRGIQIIWDLFHFGWPAHLDIFAPEWVDSFTRFASEFGRLLRREMSETPFVAPANENLQYRFNILKYRLLEKVDLALPRKPGHQMLRPLEDEIPPKVGETDQSRFVLGR